jgi:hypothetical protein
MCYKVGKVRCILLLSITGIFLPVEMSFVVDIIGMAMGSGEVIMVGVCP